MGEKRIAGINVHEIFAQRVVEGMMIFLDSKILSSKSIVKPISFVPPFSGISREGIKPGSNVGTKVS